MINFYLRFFPGEDKKAEAFAQQLPEHKLSMAALQEHFMINRNDMQAAVKDAKNILKNNDTVEEMTVAEWLYRLNLTRHLPKFMKNKVLFVSEIGRYEKDGFLNDQFKFNESEHVDHVRMSLMMQRKKRNNADCAEKENFKYMSKSGARTILYDFCIHPTSNFFKFCFILGFMLCTNVSQIEYQF